MQSRRVRAGRGANPGVLAAKRVRPDSAGSGGGPPLWRHQTGSARAERSTAGTDWPAELGEGWHRATPRTGVDEGFVRVVHDSHKQNPVALCLTDASLHHLGTVSRPCRPPAQPAKTGCRSPVARYRSSIGSVSSRRLRHCRVGHDGPAPDAHATLRVSSNARPNLTSESRPEPYTTALLPAPAPWEPPARGGNARSRPRSSHARDPQAASPRQPSLFGRQAPSFTWAWRPACPGPDCITTPAYRLFARSPVEICHAVPTSTHASRRKRLPGGVMRVWPRPGAGSKLRRSP